MMPSTCRNNRKKQTRLSFTPLPSSSPTTVKHPNQAEPRIAAVLYQDPTKTQRLAKAPTDGILSNQSKAVDLRSSSNRTDIAVILRTRNKDKSENGVISYEGLPTPTASSQVEHGEVENDDLHHKEDRNTGYRSSSLDSYYHTNNSYRSIMKPFNGSSVSASTGTITFPKTPDRPVKRRDPTAHPATPSTKRQRYPSSSDMEDISRLPASATQVDHVDTLQQEVRDGEDTDVDPVRQVKHTLNRAPITMSSDDDSEGAIVGLTTPRRSRRKAGNGIGSPHTLHKSRPIISPHVNTRSFLLGGTAGYAPVSSSRVRKIAAPIKSKIGTSPRLTRRSKTAKPSSAVTESREVPARRTKRSYFIQPHVFISSGEESDNSISALQESRHLRKAIIRSTPKTHSVADDDVVTTPKRPTKITETESVIELNEDSEEDIVPSIKRKRIHQLTKYSLPDPAECPRTQAQEDIHEDLQTLRNTEVRQSRTRTRASTSQKTKAQKQLELLRRSRAARGTVEDSSKPKEPPIPVSSHDDSDPESEHTPNIRTELSEDVEEDSGMEAVRQAVEADSDVYDEDFVDDDNGDDSIGAPGLEEIPLEYTRHAHKRPIEHFRDAVEWMVHNRINPAFARNDPIYRTAFYKLDDVVKGYASSKFLSAAWTGDFAIAIKARPEIHEVAVPTIFDHKCDACNRAGHPAKFRITFGGKAYDHSSLEPISDDDDADGEGEEAEKDSDSGSYDSRGNLLPAVSHEYFIGRFCKANATFAHALLHWRYHLNEWVLDWLKNQGYTSAEKIVERENWSIKKRGDFGNKVVDEMEEKGEIKALYRDFKINLEAAREAKPNKYKDR